MGKRPGPTELEVLAFLLEGPQNEAAFRARWHRVGWVWQRQTLEGLIRGGLVIRHDGFGYLITPAGVLHWMQRPPMPRI